MLMPWLVDPRLWLRTFAITPVLGPCTRLCLALHDLYFQCSSAFYYSASHSAPLHFLPLLEPLNSTPTFSPLPTLPPHRNDLTLTPCPRPNSIVSVQGTMYLAEGRANETSSTHQHIAEVRAKVISSTHQHMAEGRAKGTSPTHQHMVEGRANEASSIAQGRADESASMCEGRLGVSVGCMHRGLIWGVASTPCAGDEGDCWSPSIRRREDAQTP